LAAASLTVRPRRTYRQAALLPETLAKRIVVVATLAGVLTGPLYLSPYATAIAIAIGIGVIGAVATNLIIGVADQPTIGNAAFMAIGAFVAAEAVLYWHWPMFFAVVLGGAVAGFVGLLIGIPALRVRGLYLVVATLALYYVTIYAFTQYQSRRVGSAGFLMPRLSIGGLTSDHSWYFVVMGTALLCVFVMRNLVRLRYGRAWFALARDEIAASVLGVNVRQQKILVFGVTSFMIGIQGALFGYYIGVVSVDPFTFDLAVSYVAMIVIGGQGRTAGSVLGAVFVVGLPYAVTQLSGYLPSSTAQSLQRDLFNLQGVIYGAAIVLFLVLEPRGLIYIWDRIKTSVGLWPLSRKLERPIDG
jgi:branched-chain amino acid transport system permease protein